CPLSRCHPLCPYTSLFRSVRNPMWPNLKMTTTTRKWLTLPKTPIFLFMKSSMSKIWRFVYDILLLIFSNFTLLLDSGQSFKQNRSEEHTSELQSRFEIVCS